MLLPKGSISFCHATNTEAGAGNEDRQTNHCGGDPPGFS
jgi:hypothetical protein